MKKHRSLPASKLRWKCPASHFRFKNTKELEPLDHIIGQPRAIESLQLGAKLFSPGYNIFVSGLSGTGRLTTVKRILETVRSPDTPLHDYCYVYNFQNTDQPRLLKFDRGLGKAFCKAMSDALSLIRLRIPQMFEEEGFQETRRDLIKKYKDKEKKLLNEFNEKIRPQGFILGQVENDNGKSQPEILITYEEKVYTIDELDELIQAGTMTIEQARKIGEHYQKFQDDLVEIIRTGVKLTQEFRRALLEHDKLAAGVIVSGAIDEVRQEFKDEGDGILQYLTSVQDHILENIQIFDPNNANAGIEAESASTVDDAFEVYKVNNILDNSETEHPPVIIETTPSFVNLFGAIEKKFDQRGFWKTDFSHIKAGSLLRADGGYLIINALDMFGEPGVWKALKRVLLHRKLEILPMDSFFQISQTTLKPEPIGVNVKIILIGDEDIYRTLYFHEEDFKKIFKINATFDYETELTPDLLQYYARFIHTIVKEENLVHFDRSGVAALIEFSMELAGRRERLTLKFSDLADVVRESSFYAQNASSKLVRRDDVECALRQRRWRNDLMDEKIRDEIINGSLMIDTAERRVGQINGLSVYSTGLISFGKPSRITASVGVGAAGIVNIEREVELSGSTHDKGVLILTGFLRQLFAVNRPISMSASITFEQSYHGIDGDSASSAETYALLSALADVPLKQNLAVTGSVNQKGDIQPIGGVNEKIQGFFEICATRGLTGDQGVLIPVQNVVNLMLSQELIAAVRAKEFHIYPISSIEEGIHLLTDVPAGAPNAEGVYPEHTIFGKVEAKLESYRTALGETESTETL